MSLVLNGFYDSKGILPRVRTFLARNRESSFGEEELANKLEISVCEAQTALEALRDEDGGLLA